jgi:hypothetical protein
MNFRCCFFGQKMTVLTEINNSWKLLKWKLKYYYRSFFFSLKFDFVLLFEFTRIISLLDPIFL